MRELAIKYSNFELPRIVADPSLPRKDKGLVILLTGATGALGTHLLDVLRSRSEVERVYCLLRASDSFVAFQRVNKALKSKAKAGLQPIGSIDKKITCIPCNLAEYNLGMEESMLRGIRSSVDMIIHAAWAVNFTLRLKSFDLHLAGVQNLLRLGYSAAHLRLAPSADNNLRRRHVNFVYCSSIASVSCLESASIAESGSQGPSDASPLGYSRSKWVAESICVNAHRAAKEAGIPLGVEILRIGQLCGDTNNGIWNKTEAWPLMLSTFDVVGCLPNLPDEQLNWLPLDIAANSICEVAFADVSEDDSRMEPQVYHILNPHSSPSWVEMICWLREREGDRLQIVEPAAWLQSLEEHLVTDHPNHPSRKLMGLWKETYVSEVVDRKGKPNFSVKISANVSKSIASVTPVSMDLVEKMWTWLRMSNQVDVDGARP